MKIKWTKHKSYDDMWWFKHRTKNYTFRAVIMKYSECWNIRISLYREKDGLIVDELYLELSKNIFVSIEDDEFLSYIKKEAKKYIHKFYEMCKDFSEVDL